jgi:alkane 1-monooxygenase
MSLLVPGAVGIGPVLMLASGQAWTLWLPALFFYVLAPLIDRWLGEDLSNPPENAVPALDADRYYRWITYLLVPVLWLSFIFSAWFVATQSLPWHGLVAMVLICGSVGGFCINLGHELGHKNTALERWLAKIILAPSGYGHFSIEHNRGHHRDVATPIDPASSRMGESIYRFVLREMPGAFRRAWQLETDRLRQQRQAVWSLHNEILQPALITLLLWGGLMLWLGVELLPFLLSAAFWASTSSLRILSAAAFASASLTIFSMSASERPPLAWMRIDCSLLVALSLAATWTMPLASMSKVTSICGMPRGAGGMPIRSN